MPMPSSDPKPEGEKAKQGIVQTAKIWGDNPLPPTLLATLITAQHLKPLQKLPLAFAPILVFSSYLNIQGFKTDSAGLTSAWSAAYFVLARRRKQAGGIGAKLGARGMVRGATLGLCAVNAVGGGLAYAFGERGRGEPLLKG
ncbi:hypothetical protein MBLNU230_g6295t1 [Neophaeotheca triangularis]